MVAEGLAVHLIDRLDRLALVGGVALDVALLGLPVRVLPGERVRRLVALAGDGRYRREALLDAHHHVAHLLLGAHGDEVLVPDVGLDQRQRLGRQEPWLNGVSIQLWCRSGGTLLPCRLCSDKSASSATRCSSSRVMRQRPRCAVPGSIPMTCATDWMAATSGDVDMLRFAFEIPSQAAATGVIDYLADVQPQLNDVTKLWLLGYHLEMAATPAPNSIRVQIDSSIGNLVPSWYSLATASTTPTAQMKGGVLLYPLRQQQSSEVLYNFPYLLMERANGAIQRLQVRVGNRDLSAGVTFSSLVLYFGLELSHSTWAPPRRSEGTRFTIGSMIGKA